MLLTSQDLVALKVLLHDAKRKPEKHCDTPHQQNGNNYRLEYKPFGNEARLVKAGFEVERLGDKKDRIHVRVPLGVHGADHLAIDPQTKEVFCALCKGDH